MRRLPLALLLVALLPWPAHAACNSWVMTEIGWACSSELTPPAPPPSATVTGPVPGYPAPVPGDFWTIIVKQPGSLTASVYTSVYMCNQALSALWSHAQANPALKMHVGPCTYQRISADEWLPN